MISYEYPINERTRTLLRLEDLCGRVNFFLTQDDAMAHHAALTTLFEIIDVASRADLKTDLMQELERQKQILAPLRNNPAVSEDALEVVLNDIEKASSGLFAMPGKIGQHIRDNEWLMNIKQRTGIPGGACEFDLPSYHHWLNQMPEKRMRDMKQWLSPLAPIENGIGIVLKILRESGRTLKYVAQHGCFQQILAGRTAQMLSVSLDENLPYIPEISANKYALNIRFVTAEIQQRPKSCENDIEFKLSFYNL
ncbi:MAG: cell division protein ZapD [Burkholderiales bacterium]|nr:cell division protein ZapD [Burkholderiales bacterium]